MSTNHEPTSPLPLTDPNREPIRAVDQVTFHASKGTHVDITCSALIPKPIDSKDWVNEGVVTARLRMNLPMARAFAQGLLKQIAMVEAHEGTVN